MKTWSSLSNRQYPMLRMFCELGIGKFMSIEDAQHWDQRPFRSVLIRGWVVYTAGRGFHVTKTGREAYRTFLNTDIARKNATLPLTAYFENVYGGATRRKPPGESRLRVVAA